MPEMPLSLRPPPSRTPVIRLVILASLFSLVVFWLITYKERIEAPGCPVFGYNFTGVVFNKLTKERLAGVKLDCGTSQAVSDRRGYFAVPCTGWQSLGRCQVTADGFEPQQIEGQPGQRTGVELAPDPISTVDKILEWEKQAEFGAQYDLLCPDVRRSWTREEYTRLLSETQSRRIVAVEHGQPVHLPTWNYYGDVYTDVVAVPTWITFEHSSERKRIYWEAHLIKVDGLWHWFREPGL